MSKTFTTIAVVAALAPAASVAAAQDYRSPDARAVVVTQDFRSPDARPVPAQPVAQDLRSPDAQPSGRFEPTASTTAVDGSSSFDWAYLAILAAIPLLLVGGYLITVRRGRDSVALGS